MYLFNYIIENQFLRFWDLKIDKKIIKKIYFLINLFKLFYTYQITLFTENRDIDPLFLWLIGNPDARGATWWILCHRPAFFSSCSWCQPYCCYQIESRVCACGFSLPFISTKHYRYAGAQPSSYFPSCPLYIYIDVYEIVSRWPCQFSLDPFIDRWFYIGRKTKDWERYPG